MTMSSGDTLDFREPVVNRAVVCGRGGMPPAGAGRSVGLSPKSQRDFDRVFVDEYAVATRAGGSIARAVQLEMQAIATRSQLGCVSRR